MEVRITDEGVLKAGNAEVAIENGRPTFVEFRPAMSMRLEWVADQLTRVERTWPEHEGATTSRMIVEARNCD